jgi:hypothetical protein
MKKLVFLAAVALMAQSQEKTVTGWVLDSACAFTKGLSKPVSRDCACLRAQRIAARDPARRRFDLLADFR